MKSSLFSKFLRRQFGALAVTALALAPVSVTHAADIFWSGGTDSYTNAASWGGSVPGVADKAINDNGAGNVVQINLGDPDWIVNGIFAGRSSGNGAFEQNGQTVYLTNATGRGAVRLGVAANRTGLYTINGGALNYTGEFNVGELGPATLNVNGGSIAGSGNLAINVGSSLDAVTGTMDGGTNKDGHTWFEQGLYAPDASRGLPAAGSTVVSASQGDHSYTMPPSYAANNAVFLYNGLPNATITLSAPTAATALSFLGSSGGGEATLNYTIHHSGGVDQSGTLLIPDWYPPGSATVAVNVGGRVRANGFDYQNVGGAIEFPKLVSVDLPLTDTVNPVTSIDLTYVSGGRAGLLAVSRSVGADFTPVTITGYNLDIVMGATEPIYVANTVTNVLTQTAGSIDITGELFVGNYGAGIYNLNGGTNTFRNWTAIGRSSGSGVLNMSGGELNRIGNGDLLIGSGYQNIPGRTPSGVLNHSGGVINSTRPFLCPENSPAVGAYNISSTAVFNLSDWFVIGRAGASGTFTMTGGTINKTGGGNFSVGENGSSVGTANHSAGTINVSGGEFFIGNNGGMGTYNLSGTAAINHNNWFVVGRDGGNGTLTMTGGSITKTDNGVFIVGDNTTGSLNQSAGTISANELWVGQGGSGNGTYDLSATASLAVSGYVVIGRDGVAQFNMSGGTFSKTTGGGHFIIASGGSGNLAQTGGNVVSTLSDTWIAENGTATWTLSGSATATLSKLVLGLNGSGSGTLNLDGGTMTVNEIAGGSGSSTVSFNGGTLVAAANNANFLHGLTTATLGSGGVTINTAGFNVTSAQALQDGGGALTKNGAGTLTLSAPNAYAGATTINTGGFGVLVTADNSQLSVGSVGFAGSLHTLDMDLSTFGSPGAAPLAITGALDVNGTVTVNILASGALQIGVYPLVTCGSRTGAGTFALGTLPLNTVATLVDSGTTISLNITDVNAPRWEGLDGGNWDIGLTTNWINGGSGLPTYFSEGSEVLFNDEALGTTSVNLVTTVHPTSVTFNNTNLAYALSGSGKISGTTGLAKQGTGTLTIANINDFTGPTVISAGVVSVTNLANSGSPSPIGSGNLALAGGTLSYAGPAVAINRGYTLQGSSSIDAQGDLSLSGPVTVSPGKSFAKLGSGQLAYVGGGSNSLTSGNWGDSFYHVRAGSLLLSGPAGGQTNSISGALSLNGAVSASAVLTNTTLNCGDLYVGNESGMQGSLVIENGTTINDNSWFILDNATATINGGTITVPGRLFLCERPGTTATLNINGGVINKNGDYFAVVNGGWNGAGARTGVVNQVAGTVGGGAELWVGDGGGAGGNDSLGIYNLGGGTLTVNNWMGVGRDGCQGIFNMTNGTFNKGGGGDMVIGRGGDNTIGIFNMSGGALNKSSGNPLIIGQNSGHGQFNQTGGTLTVDSEYWVGVDNNTTDATNNIGGTSVCNFNNWVSLGRSGTAIVNFTGGTITKAGGGNFIVGDNGTSIFTHSGGGTLTINNELWIGQAGGGVGRYDLSDGTVSVNSYVAVGREGANGTFNMSGGSFTKTGGGNFLVPSSSNSRGTLNHSGGTINVASGQYLVPEGGNATTFGTNIISGTAVVTVNSWVAFGRGSGFGLLDMSGGLFAKVSDSGSSFIVGANGPGWVTQTGGTISNTVSSTWISEGNTATWDMSGGSNFFGFLQFARNGSGVATLNFNGGTIAASEIAGGAGLATNNYNGGTIVARASTANFLHDLDAANVLAGGLTIDTDTQTIGVAQALVDGGGGGGLTKNGTGTLNLNGVNTYTGATLVNAGTLGGTGTIAGPVTVAATAGLAPGTSIGTLTVNNSVTLGGATVMELSKNGGVPSSDLLTVSGNLEYAGTLTVVLTGTNGLAFNDTFNLFDWSTRSGSFTTVVLPAGYQWDTSQLNVNGTIRVTAVTPAVISSSTLSGGNLILTGAGGPPGASYTWVTATNIGAPIWTTNLTGVFDGSGGFSNALPINTSEPARFFRLQTP